MVYYAQSCARNDKHVQGRITFNNSARMEIVFSKQR